MGLIRFEVKRVFKDKIIPFVMLAIILIVGSSSLLSKNKTSFEQETSNSMQYNYASNLGLIKSNEADPESHAFVERLKHENELMEIYFEKESNSDEKGMMIAELNILKNSLKMAQAGNESGLTIQELQQNIAILEYLIENNLTKLYEKDNSNPALYQVLDFFYNYEIYLIIASLLIAYLMSADRRLHVVNFINSTPIGLAKLATIKFIVPFIFGFFISILPALTIFFATLRKGLGSWNYPIVTSGNRPNLVIESLGMVLLKIVVLLFIVMLLISTFIFLLTRFTGNIFLVSAAVLSLILIKNYVPEQGTFLFNYWSRIPMSYFDVAGITTSGQMYRPIIDPNISWHQGMKIEFCSLIIVVIFVVISIIKRRKI